MLLGIIRFFKGTVSFRAQGRSPERLLNLTAQRGVLLWNVRPSPQGLEGEVAARDYRRIRPLARKAAVRTTVLKKSGFPFLAAAYRGRAGLAVGAALGAALLVFLSQFLWTIDVVGQEHVSEARLRTLLAESGVKTGALCRGVDAGQVKRDILLKVEDISWLSVNIVGCHANVEIKEKTRKPENDGDTPCNLKAKEDGVITKITVGEGVTEVKKGSGVAKGDLLVSGVSAAREGTVRYLHAEGEIMADVISEKEFKLPKEDDYISLTENKAERRQLGFLIFRFPCTLSFRFFASAARTEEADWLTADKTALPLGFVTETLHELKTERVTRDENNARAVFNRAALLEELFAKGEGRRVSKELTVAENDGAFTGRVRWVFNENIAESVDFSVEE